MANRKGLNRQKQKMALNPGKTSGRCKVTSFIVITLSLECNSMCRRKKHSLFRWSTSWPERLVQIWMSCRKNEHMIFGMWTRIEFCEIFGKESRKFTLLKHLLRDICASGETDRRSSNNQTWERVAYPRWVNEVAPIMYGLDDLFFHKVPNRNIITSALTVSIALQYSSSPITPLSCCQSARPWSRDFFERTTKKPTRWLYPRWVKVVAPIQYGLEDLSCLPSDFGRYWPRRASARYLVPSERLGGFFTSFAKKETVWDVMKEFMFFTVFDFAANAEETIPVWQLDEVKSNKRDYSGSTKRQNERPLCYLRFVISIKCCQNQKYQKYKGRVVLRCDIEKVDSGAHAVFIEQGSSGSPMTAARVMDVIASLRDSAGEAADAVSAYTQVIMEDAARLLSIPKSECPEIWIRFSRHKWPNHGRTLKDLVVLLERNLDGHPLAGILWERQFAEVPLELGW